MGLALGAAAIGGVASLGGALISSNAAKSASDAQVAAADRAQATQVQAANVATGALAPYNQIGTGAENTLANLYGVPYAATGTGLSSTSPSGVVTPGNINAAVSSPGGSAAQDAAYANFSKSPDYKFAFDQGMQALQRSAAAGGTLVSGGQLKAGQEFGQGLATQQFGHYVSGLQSLASMGQNAAAGTASNTLASGNAIGNTQQAAGQAAASGIVGSANAINSGLSGVSSSVMNSLLLSKLGGTSPSAYTALPNTLPSALPNWSGLG